MQQNPIEVKTSEIILRCLMGKIYSNAIDILRLKTTFEAFKLAKDIEFERLEKYNEEVTRYLEEHFPFCSYFHRSRFPLSIFFNDANCAVHDSCIYWATNMLGGQPRDIKPSLEGWSKVLTYQDIHEGTRLSIDVIKENICNMEVTKKIKRKRGVSGYYYFINDESIIDYFHENVKKEEWYPVDYSPSTDKIEKSPQYLHILSECIERHSVEINGIFISEVAKIVHNLECEIEKID